MPKKDFYIMYNYKMSSENVRKEIGWEYTLDNGVVVYLQKKNLWFSTEKETGRWIAKDKNKMNCLDQTKEMMNGVKVALETKETKEYIKYFKEKIKEYEDNNC